MMYHLYSHNDLDGVGCGIIAKAAFGEQVEVRYNSVTGLDVQVERFLDRAKDKGKKRAVYLSRIYPFIKKMKTG